MSTLLALSKEEELALRSQVRQALAANIPAEHVELVLDLAMFATQSALQSVDRVLSSAADQRHFVAALSPAIGLIAGRCQQIEQGLAAYARANGMHAGTARVAFGAEQ